MRFPRLGRAVEQIKAEVAALKLPHTVAVALPRDLGSDEMRIEIRARNGTEFRESLRALADSADGVETDTGFAWRPELETRILGKGFRQNFQTKLSGTTFRHNFQQDNHPT